MKADVVVEIDLHEDFGGAVLATLNDRTRKTYTVMNDTGILGEHVPLSALEKSRKYADEGKQHLAHATLNRYAFA